MDDLLVAIKLSQSSANLQTSETLQTDGYQSDYEYALKLSAELNRSPEKFPSKTPKITTCSVRTSSESFSTDITDEEFLLAVDLTETSISSCGVKSSSEERNGIDRDFLLALQLAEEDSDIEEMPSERSSSKNAPRSSDLRNIEKYADITLSVVDPSWELIDPNPDIYSLFAEFNRRFFWQRLDMVEVRWSPRMTTCAGICRYASRAGYCVVSLSKPLLVLRPRKDLVETLLVYHSFHDEVKHYKTHWWKCDGSCATKPPYFGLVKRATNRAPAANDFWWADHMATCGGKFHKIREPEGFNQKKSAKKTEAKTSINKKIKSPANQPSVLDFFPKTINIKNAKPVSASTSKTNNASKLTSRENTFSSFTNSIASINQKITNNGLNQGRIFTLSDLSSRKRSSTNTTSNDTTKKISPLKRAGNIRYFKNTS